MNIVETFHALVMLLLIDPASDRVEELLAELAAQAAHQIHDKATEHLLLRCVRWDNPDVYYALDALLHHYAYQLTAKPGPIKGTTILGIKRLPEPNHQATQPRSTVNGDATAHAQEGTTA